MKKSVSTEEKQWMEQRTRGGEKWWVEPGTCLLVSGIHIHEHEGLHYLVPPDDPLQATQHFICLDYANADWDNTEAKIPWDRGHEFFEAVGMPTDYWIVLGSGGTITLQGELEQKAWQVARAWGCVVRENTRGI